MSEDTAEMKANNYIEETKEQIRSALQQATCQPILFVGSGLSRRYFQAPSWDELLKNLASNCPLIDKDFAYYQQSLSSPIDIGEEFSKIYHEWAWTDGKKHFPKDLFAQGVSANAYIKHAIAQYLNSISPTKISEIEESKHQVELTSLQAIKPHAIITTNYDPLLEMIFPDYFPIIGQNILTGSSLAVGEIFKIHGCISDPKSLVFTRSDYEDFSKKKKYLSAKLLTFFSEHPLLFVGYGASDPNIRAILSDIDEALPMSGGVIPNIFLLEWAEKVPERPSKEKLIAIEDSKSVRVNAIVASDFHWVFEAFGSQQALNSISAKTLRALLSRSYDLVRHDIPRKIVHADFEMLEHAVSDNEEFAKLFGLTTISDASFMSATYPYNLTAVSKKLGFNYWSKTQQLIDVIKKQKGCDIKASDNKYHAAIKYGKLPVHMYSESAVNLLQLVKSGKDYELGLKS